MNDEKKFTLMVKSALGNSWIMAIREGTYEECLAQSKLYYLAQSFIAEVKDRFMPTKDITTPRTVITAKDQLL